MSNSKFCPETSSTLLRDLARDSQHARWGEFAARYRPMMEAYMRERFPSVDADDAIQETLVALIRVFPVYRHSPGEKGAFHNYLTGILRRKALSILDAEKRRAGREGEYAASAAAGETSAAPDWRAPAMEIALRQLLADESVNERTRRVFERVAVKGESPEAVAAAYGIERNAVDQIRFRMTARLKRFVAALGEAGGYAV